MQTREIAVPLPRRTTPMGSGRLTGVRRGWLNPGHVPHILEGDVIQNGQRLRSGWAGVAEAGTLDEHFHSDTGGVVSHCL